MAPRRERGAAWLPAHFSALRGEQTSQGRCLYPPERPWLQRVAQPLRVVSQISPCAQQ